VLKVNPTPDQAEFVSSLLLPPYRSKVRSGHNVGKTWAAAWAVNFWFDTRDPAVVITTAPTERDVIDLLWTEIRLQRSRAGLPQPFIGPSAPEMRTSEEHFAKGYTARKGESFQGRHRERMLFVFDEDEGIDPVYWKTTNTMFQPDGEHAWLAIGNPTTTSSQSYMEELLVSPDGSSKWRMFTLNALNHPNVLAGLRGERPPVPNAVTIGQVEQWIKDGTTPINAGEHKATDIEWPPGSGKWVRPGPDFESRCLGRRPSTSGDTVWGDLVWGMAEVAILSPITTDIPEIGCDVARFGFDNTEMHVRCGPCSMHHESHNGWATTQTTGRLKELAREWAEWVNVIRRKKRWPDVEPTDIPVKIDDSGVGGAIVDQADGYNFQGVGASDRAYDPEHYPNRRSELWFALYERAYRGELSLTRLPRRILAELKRQAMTPKWALDGAGRRVVEPKDATKKTLGRSPDGMDSMNLSYSPARGNGVASWIG
jgi:hypothetical protein